MADGDSGPPRRRRSDSLASILGRQIAAITAVVAIASTLFLIGSKLISIGSSIQTVNDNVVANASRNCQISAGIVNGLRVTIAQEITHGDERKRILALFPPVNCAPLDTSLSRSP